MVDTGGRLVAGVDVGGVVSETVVYLCEIAKGNPKILKFGAWRGDDTRGELRPFQLGERRTPGNISAKEQMVFEHGRSADVRAGWRRLGACSGEDAKHNRSEQAQLRELYLTRVEEVEPELRTRFQQLYRYY